MINDYHNSLAISSNDIDQLDSFVSKAFSSGKYSGSLTFSNFLPCPEIANRYTWRLENWGSCCEPFNIMYTRDYFEYVEYSFYTVGNSCIPFCERISTLYPNLEFELFVKKPNEGIFVRAKIVNGIVIYKDASKTDLPVYIIKSICLRNMIDQVNTAIKNLELLKGLFKDDQFVSFLYSLSLTEEMEELLVAHFKDDFELAKEYNPGKIAADFFNSLDDEDKINIS